MSLEESNDYEEAKFDEVLDELVVYEPELEVHKEVLMGKLGTENTLRMLDRLFHKHIVFSWLPRALNTVRGRYRSVRKRLVP